MRSRRPRARRGPACRGPCTLLPQATRPRSDTAPSQHGRPVPAKAPHRGECITLFGPRNPHTRALGKGDIPEPGISAVARDTQLCREQPSAVRSPTAPGTVELAATEGCLQPPAGVGC